MQGEKIALAHGVSIFRCTALPSSPWTSDANEPIHFVFTPDGVIHVPVCDARFICGAKPSSRYQRGSDALDIQCDKTVTHWLCGVNNDLYQDTYYYALPGGLAGILYDFHRDEMSRDDALRAATELEAALLDAAGPAEPAPPQQLEAILQTKIEEMQRVFQARLEQELQTGMRALDAEIDRLVERKRQALEARIIAPQQPGSDPKYTVRC